MRVTSNSNYEQRCGFFECIVRAFLHGTIFYYSNGKIYVKIDYVTHLALVMDLVTSTGVTNESHGFLPVLIFVMNYSVAGF